jgi:lysine 2,3-aminomutase
MNDTLTNDSINGKERQTLEFPASFTGKTFRNEYYQEVPIHLWNDWKWQLKNRITAIDQLEKIINLQPDEVKAIKQANVRLPLAITPYYAGLMSKGNDKNAIRRTVIPDIKELVKHPDEHIDPLSEDEFMTVPGLIRKYPDKVLFLSTSTCATYCRYCSRSRLVGKVGEIPYGKSNWENAFNYIRSNVEIRDVLISGGDPLILNDESLNLILSKLKQIDHVEFVRIGTKIPVVMPQRINNTFIDMLKKHIPVWFSIHFIHPDEITQEVKIACNKLADAGIPMGSQTVLLKGINDNFEIQLKLYHELLKIRIRPYYLYQCDPIIGSKHFRTEIKTGVEIINNLRMSTSGYAIPTYILDTVNGKKDLEVYFYP